MRQIGNEKQGEKYLLRIPMNLHILSTHISHLTNIQTWTMALILNIKAITKLDFLTG